MGQLYLDSDLFMDQNSFLSGCSTTAILSLAAATTTWLLRVQKERGPKPRPVAGEKKMVLLRRVLPPIGRSGGPNLFANAARAFSTSDPAALKKAVASLLDSISLKPGGTIVQNCGDSEEGRAVIELAKERKIHTISIIEDKPGNPDTIEELKGIGADVVVPESYTKTWYMKRLTSELNPAAGINFSNGYQATAVAKAVATGGTFVSYGKKLPKHVVYGGSPRKAIEWDAYLKDKKVKVVNL